MLVVVVVYLLLYVSLYIVCEHFSDAAFAIWRIPYLGSNMDGGQKKENKLRDITLRALYCAIFIQENLDCYEYVDL